MLMTMHEKFIKRLKMTRMEKGISQQELAKHIGNRTRASISKIESGLVMVNTETMKKMADYLGVSPSWLAGWDDKK